MISQLTKKHWYYNLLPSHRFVNQGGQFPVSPLFQYDDSVFALSALGYFGMLLPEGVALDSLAWIMRYVLDSLFPDLYLPKLETNPLDFRPLVSYQCFSLDKKRHLPTLKYLIKNIIKPESIVIEEILGYQKDNACAVLKQNKLNKHRLGNKSLIIKIKVYLKISTGTPMTVIQPLQSLLAYCEIAASEAVITIHSQPEQNQMQLPFCLGNARRKEDCLTT